MMEKYIKIAEWFPISSTDIPKGIDVFGIIVIRNELAYLVVKSNDKENKGEDIFNGDYYIGNISKYLEVLNPISSPDDRFLKLRDPHIIKLIDSKIKEAIGHINGVLRFEIIKRWEVE